MFGEIGGWMYKALAGIKPDLEKPGFENIIVKPYFIAALQHVEAQYDSPRGIIKSAWTREKKSLKYSLTFLLTQWLPFTFHR
jgi:alpha-L-rhamnosidase